MKIIVLIIAIFFSVSVAAQSPQFAVVRPNGTTYICPTWDSAYNKAVDGDNIYLPGVTINSALSINKNLKIYGAGHYPDSSATTGKTIINNDILIDLGAAGGQLEGLQCSNILFVLHPTQFSGYTIRRCRFDLLNLNPNNSSIALPTNLTISECLLKYVYSWSVFPENISFTKNIFKGWEGGGNYSTSYIKNSNFNNNIFLISGGYYINAENCSFQNNIFLSTGVLASACSNSFYNNLSVGNSFSIYTNCGNNITVISSIVVPTQDDIFATFSGPGGFPYTDNYHLKPSSLGKKSGNDGTDVGIYGTSQPTSEGWVPSNPHIYFKQVDANTTSDGKLHVKYKVRTNQ